MRAPLPLLLCGLAVILSACGTPSADLLAVTRTGEVPGAALRLLVSDGGAVRCNGGAPRDMGSARLLRARALTRDLAPEAQRRLALPARTGSILRYRFRLASGTVAFADNSPGQSPELRRAALLTRDLAQDVCGLPR